MRDYLFRGKTADGKWHFGDGIYYGPRGVLITSETETVMVDSKTVGVVIKRQDVNGKQIYTGDIVLINGDEQKTVTYLEEDAKFILTGDNFMYGFDDLYNTEIEVIGNIHDNPELFKEEVD